MGLSLRASAAASGLGAAVLLCGFMGACGTSSTGAPGDGEGGAEGGPLPGEEGGDPDQPGTCGPTVKPGFLDGQTIKVGAVSRTYAIFVPATYDAKKSFPVVFVLQGDGGTGASIRNAIKLEGEAAGSAIFVYPDGTPGGEAWHFDNGDVLKPDIAFIDALAASVAKTHCIDDKRFFAVGFSRGAYFANLLGCMAKTPFRAVVGHSGGGPYNYAGLGTSEDPSGNLVCPRSPTPAALQIIGDADGLLDDARGSRDHWRRVNACKTTSKPFDPSPCIAFDGCAAARPEIYCEIPGMGHTIWTNASKVIWAFLKSK